MRKTAIGLFFYLTCSLFAQQDSAFVIEKVRIFDGEKFLPAQSVYVAGGKVQAMGENLAVPEQVRRIDGSGKTLLPGLIDAHVHIFSRDQLRQAAVFGTTTVLDMFMHHRMAQQIKADIASGKLPDAADLLSATTLVTAPGGHGTQYGFTIPTITDPDSAQAFVDARIAEGADYIKIVYDDGTSYNRPIPTLSFATLEAVIRAAHKRGKLAVVHTGSVQEAMQAIRAGADGLVHLFLPQNPADDFLGLAQKNKVFIIPTLTVLESAAGINGAAELTEDERLQPYLSSLTAANLRHTFPIQEKKQAEFARALRLTRDLLAAGVAILAGSDAPNPGTAHGVSLHRELALLVAAGFTPEQALRAATSLPAEKFSLPDRGRIAPGLRADLVLIHGDPGRDITATRDIIAVWKRGRQIDRDGFREKIAAQARSEDASTEKPLELAGLISDFESGELSSAFGAGWSLSTDQMIGGKSTATYAVIADSLAAGNHCLRISGEIIAAVPNTWAGIMFSPGTQMMAPADLSSKKAIRFRARSPREQVFVVMIFSKSRGFMPSIRTFRAGPDWQEFSFPFAEFDGSDGRGMMGFFWGSGGGQTGRFELLLDDVRLD